MTLPACKGCDLPVLELEGQFEKLDSFYLDEGGPPRESAGYWHTRCLIESGLGQSWYAARRRNYVDVRAEYGVFVPVDLEPFVIA